MRSDRPGRADIHQPGVSTPGGTVRARSLGPPGVKTPGSSIPAPPGRASNPPGRLPPPPPERRHGLRLLVLREPLGHAADRLLPTRLAGPLPRLDRLGLELARGQERGEVGPRLPLGIPGAPPPVRGVAIDRQQAEGLLVAGDLEEGHPAAGTLFELGEDPL